MAELNIKSVQDLSKLNGCRIENAQFSVNGVDPVITLDVSHPALIGKIARISFIGTVSFGRSGNVFLVNTGITIHTEDIIKANIE